MVKRLTQKELNIIANNFKLTNHAVKRFNSRLKKYGINIKQSIINSSLAYYNTDGSINIQVYNRCEYYVFVKADNCYLMITCKEQSKNYYSLYDKFLLAGMGCERKILN